jgi:hypothetical protein
VIFLDKEEFEEEADEQQFDESGHKAFGGNFFLIPLTVMLAAINIFNSMWPVIYTIIALVIIGLIYRYINSIIFDCLIAILFTSYWTYAGWYVGNGLLEENIDGANYGGLLIGLLIGLLLNRVHLKRIFTRK